MLNLDDTNAFKAIDAANMLSLIEDLPNQLEAAWAHSSSQPLLTLDDVRSIVICGMGGSAISGDLFAALAAESLPLPISVVRGYDLPACAAGPGTLVIALSHSGGTEETISAARQAAERGCRLAAITGGGALAPLVSEAGGVVWQYSYAASPRASLGWLYGLLLGFMWRHGLLPGIDASIPAALEAMRAALAMHGAAAPIVENRAKMIAGQLIGRVPVVWGAGPLHPVARRWKTQLNENAKTVAVFEELPELNHNLVVGIMQPEPVGQAVCILQLTRPQEHPRVRVRQQATQELLMVEGILTEMIETPPGDTLAQQMGLIVMGDLISYYLAMLYQVDPSPIGPIDALKERLARA